ncbi:GDSL-like Lipase/Acylhydrolase [Catalinimonas alkaloidigena]|uniref:GDSL-like Lipase/Acylhydrolase n=1 Tax=Catalinimonas alkaloidigena TaxID=1075417 RepID=A0A1G9N7L7_9BACT|nr:SGNH/GDSL hydrolase family protein [Catalinimonas alkaloidigena]SDL82470.1 GDSL-like Lipase/Acylhydrolase [Catalinimonas alkaloidigena]
MKKYSFLVITGLWWLASACEPQIDAPAPSSGELDLSRYVAVGNSLTAGYANSGLYREGQLVSYPNLLAQQFAQVGGGTFEQPLFDEAQRNGSGYLTLTGFASTGAPLLTPVAEERAIIGIAKNGVSPLLMPYQAQSGTTVQNLGVPGLRVDKVTATNYGADVGQPSTDFNPFFERLGPGSASYTTYVGRSAPSFCTVWLGNNDVLGYASSGGVGASITPVGTFRSNLQGVLDALMQQDSVRGAIANLPSVTAAPYFTTYAYNLLTLTAEQAQQAQQGYADYNAGVRQYNASVPAERALDTIAFQAGPNPLVIFDASIPAQLGQRRQIKPGELVLLTLPTDSLAAGWGTAKPVPNQYILTRPELEAVRVATDQFNAIISELATDYNLALVNMNQLLNQVRTGLSFDGVTVNAGFISGGVFSLDGVHLTPRGNALTANQFIRAINEKYGTAIPLVNAVDYEGVRLP